MTRMRELVVDLRTSEDGVQDIYGAIDALARPLRDAGIEIVIGVGVRQPIEADAALLIHRAAREILLAVRREPPVSLLAIGLRERAGNLVLTVDHDGHEREAGPRQCPILGGSSCSKSGSRLAAAPS